MYFDPLSAWLVTLIADGIIVAGEKSQGGTASEYHQEQIRHGNRVLNAEIRKIKNKYGLGLAEMAYEEIQRYIKITKNSFSFQYANGQIILDLDNQEYIIAVLEECAERFSQYETEKYRKKAEWYKNAAIEAKRKKELYAKKLEETRIRDAKAQETEKIIAAIGWVIFIVFIIFFLSLFFS